MEGRLVYIQSATAEIRRGNKKEEERRNHGKNIMSASATQGGHNKKRYNVSLLDINNKTFNDHSLHYTHAFVKIEGTRRTHLVGTKVRCMLPDNTAREYG